MAANTEHDEDLIRATWHGEEAWLGVESMQAPRHGKPIDWLAVGGNYPTGTDRKAGGTRP